MKTIGMTLVMLCTLQLTAIAADFFRPDAETARKIGSDPRFVRVMRRAEAALKAKPFNPDRRIERGKSYSLYVYTVGTTLTSQMESLGCAWWGTGDRKYADKAVELLTAACRNFPVDHPRIQQGLPGERGQMLYGIGIGCMIFGEFLSQEERVMIEKCVADYIDETVKIADNPATWWYGIHNHNGVAFGPAGIAALYFADRPGFQKRIADCSRILKRWVALGFDEQGLPCEGSVYARYSAVRVMLFSLLLSDRGGENLIATTRLGIWPRVYPDKLIPGTKLTDTRNDAWYSSPDVECLFVAAANGDGVARWIYEQYGECSEEYFPLDVLLSARPLPAAAAPEKIRDAAFFRQRELAVWRTGLTGDDAMLSFEAGPYLASRDKTHSIHAQSDRGHFSFYAFGDLWAVDSGYANDANGNREFSRSHTFAHSCVLIDGKGQARSGNGPGVSGKMLAFENNNRFGYAKADCASAYRANNWGEPGAGARRALREVMFIRPDGTEIPPYAVILDNIDRDGGEHLYTWQMILDGGKVAKVRPGGALLVNREPFNTYATTPAGAPGGRLVWKFKLDAPAKCSLWGLFRTGGVSRFQSDSFFFSIDGGPQQTWDTGAAEISDWHRISERKSTRIQPKSQVFELGAGEHTFELSTRENETEVTALFIGLEEGAAPTRPETGVTLAVDAAECSGGMKRFDNPRGHASANRCAVYLDAAGPVKMSVDAFLPDNESRPPAVIPRLRGECRAVNPGFTALVIPLKDGMKEPEVSFKRTGTTVTAEVKWPAARDVIKWDASGQGKANFERIAK